MKVDKNNTADFLIGLGVAGNLRFYPKITELLPRDVINHYKVSFDGGSFHGGGDSKFEISGSLLSIQSELAHFLHYLILRNHNLIYTDVLNCEVFDRIGSSILKETKLSTDALYFVYLVHQLGKEAIAHDPKKSNENFTPYEQYATGKVSMNSNINSDSLLQLQKKINKLVAKRGNDSASFSREISDLIGIFATAVYPTRNNGLVDTPLPKDIKTYAAECPEYKKDVVFISKSIYRFAEVAAFEFKIRFATELAKVVYEKNVNIPVHMWKSMQFLAFESVALNVRQKDFCDWGSFIKAIRIGITQENIIQWYNENKDKDNHVSSSARPDINIIYGSHATEKDFEQLKPALDAAFKNARDNKQNIVVFLEECVLGSIKTTENFKRFFPDWDIDRILSDPDYQKNFKEHYLAYLDDELKTIESYDWNVIKNQTACSFGTALHCYLAKKIVDEGYVIDIRLERPPFEYILSCIQHRNHSSLYKMVHALVFCKVRDDKLFQDITQQVKSHNGSLIVISGAEHTYLKNLFEARGYSVSSFTAKTKFDLSKMLFRILCWIPAGIATYLLLSFAMKRISAMGHISRSNVKDETTEKEKIDERNKNDAYKFSPDDDPLTQILRQKPVETNIFLPILQETEPVETIFNRKILEILDSAA